MRQAILGHKSGSITTHYSAAELRELLEAMEFIATDNPARIACAHAAQAQGGLTDTAP